MAVPVTAKFGKMRILLGAYTDLVLPVVSVSNTLPAVCTVSAANIVKFQNGRQVIIAGIADASMTSANGTKVISSVNSPANTFTLDGVDCSAGAAPATVGITVTVKDEMSGITYIAPCGLTAKNCALSKNLEEVFIKDCSDISTPVWLGRDVQSLSCSIAGDGVAAAESVPYWAAAAYSHASVPMRAEIDFGIGNTVVTGLFHIDSHAFAADSGGRVTLSINAQSDGDCTAIWTNTP